MPPQDRTIKTVVKELVAHPFFPLLFIAEAVKEASVYYINAEPLYVYFALAVIALILWTLSDVVDKESIKENVIGTDE